MSSISYKIKSPQGTREPKEQYSDYNLRTFYSKNDLSKQKIFKGNYINFGYWRNIDLTTRNKISKATRAAASKKLYSIIYDRLSLKRSDRVLEVGCGKGMGIVSLAVTYSPKMVVGLDMFEKQVNRAQILHKRILKNNSTIHFEKGLAEKIPFGNETFTKVYSIEAAQHFWSIKKFAKESYRVLVKGGVVCLATFFAKQKFARNKLVERIPTIKGGTDKLCYIADVLKYFKEAGLKKVTKWSIGKYVFEGFDLWMEQNGYGRSWGREWFKSYKEGLIDYYVITAVK